MQLNFMSSWGYLCIQSSSNNILVACFVFCQNKIAKKFPTLYTMILYLSWRNNFKIKSSAK